MTREKLIFWGFCGTFFFIPVAKSPFIILGIASLSLWFLSGKFLRDGKVLLERKKELAPAALLFLLPWLGLFYTSNVHYGLRFAESSYHWLYVFALLPLSFDGCNREYLVRSFLAGLSFTAVLVILQVMHLAPMKHEGMPIGLLSGATSHGLLSLFLAFGLLLLSFYFRKTGKRSSRIWIALLMLVQFGALSAGLGRNGQLAFVLVSPVIIFNLLDRKNFVRVVLGAVVIVILLSLSPTVQKRFRRGIEDMNQYSQGNANTSLGLRFQMWKLASKLFLDHPVFGSGTGGFGIAWKESKPTPDVFDFDDPHNTFMYVLANFGIAGLVSFLWFLAVLFLNGWKGKEDIAGFSVLSLALIVFIGSFTSSLIVGAATTAWVSAFSGLQNASSGGGQAV